MPGMPRFTVITPTWNSAKTLVRTLDSVRGQTLRDYEHLVVDNASTDGTQQLAANLHDARIRVISGPDRGLYDAMNKGIAAARGELIAILNADDVYADERVLADVEARFREAGADAVYGDLNFINAHGQVKRTWISGPYSEARWLAGWHPPHPAVFISRKAYASLAADRPLSLAADRPLSREAGEGQGEGVFYDPGYKLAADYKLLLTLGLRERAKFAYEPRVLVRMTLGGASTRGAGAILRGNREVLRAWKELGLKTPALLIPRKLLYKLRGKLGK